MSTDRPMNEYKAALFDGFMLLIRAVAHRKVDSLAADLRHAAKNDTRPDAAAALEMLAQAAETDAYFVPKSPFMVIKGGKTDPEYSN